VYVPETSVVVEQPAAFVVMSDGCEKATWKCCVINKDTGKYEHPNQPFNKFLDPMIEILKAETEEKRLNKFIEIIDRGTAVCEQEMDDKTMVVGIFDI
jgi:hypothetical protein